MRDVTEKYSPSQHDPLLQICCCAIGCDNIASIRVDLNTDGVLAFCGRHWEEVRNTSVRRRVVEVPDRPRCFRSGCPTPAVNVMQQLDGTPLAVCETHLDDLSWVEPTDVELEAARRCHE